MPTGGRKQTLNVEGREVAVSNLDKVLYPTSGFTKAHVIDYYIRVSPYLLPHLKDRPVTLKRYPDGVRGEHFYEKDAPSFTPEWVRTFPVPRRSGDSDIRYILINDLPTLVWSANLANLEIHPFLHRAPEIDRPTTITFDLDPGEGTDVLACADVAFLLKDVLDRMKLKSFAKVSGSKGIQVYVPLNTPVTYAVTQPFARTLAEFLAKERPKLIVAEMAKELRKGKVFIDWSQNADFKTTVGVYSLRAKRDHPYVSAPVTWDELRGAFDSGDYKRLYFDSGPALERFSSIGDLFKPVLKLKQKLPETFFGELRLVPPRARTNAPAPQAKKLKEYAARRDFTATAEPSGAIPRRSRQGGRRRFVIQKHAASHVHYDLRLEMHDVLKSWAVPKGVPYGAEDRRLAMATEDHPIAYLDFEGTIAAGQYGGGTVMVWDIGTYELIEGNYYKGRLHLYLSGKKLKGEWTLEKDAQKGPNSWVMRKAGEPIKPLTAKRDDTSALTARTMQQIAEENDRQWQSNRTADLPQAEMKFVEPMLAKIADSLPEGPQWQYELKLDGYRTIALRTENNVKLLSRRNNVLNERFKSVVQALEPIAPGTILDGEVVALDDEGKPSFNMLQNYTGSKIDLYYYVFDLLALRGKNVMGLPLSERREMLKNDALADMVDPIRFSQTLQAAAADLVAAAKEQGLEGLVAKRLNSVYEAGKRSGAWVKFKVNKGHELVIGGYRPGKDLFDNLAVGYYERNELVFIAKIKNGFTPQVKRQVAAKFKGLETDECPFDNLPEPKSARRGEALTAAAMRNYRWLRPELVAQVEFTEWTDTNHLRHSRFVALRDDINPRQVRRETAAE
jgi:bifunctional non-homologous end joining protein LigD